MKEEFKKEYYNKWFQYVLDHPNKSWDYSMLSRNPNITWDIVTTHPEKPWDYSLLSKNPNITWDIVRNNPIPKVGKKWCYNR